MSSRDFDMTERDIKKVAELAGIGIETLAEGSPDIEQFKFAGPDIEGLLHEMGEAAFSDDPDKFAAYAEQNMPEIREASRYSDQVVEMLLLCYRLGASRDSGACLNNLGTLYYMGDLVEQDYAKAAELYEEAVGHGCIQSVINLGYIWEYGRLGERDYAKAYECYSLACALTDSSEAVYKLGDMYGRGKFVQKDVAKAYQLWSRSLDLASNPVEAAQPAIRIAQLMLSDDQAAAGVEYDLMYALFLFQQAELGLRIDIDNGTTYYEKRLQEAIEGQEKVRDLLRIESKLKTKCFLEVSS